MSSRPQIKQLVRDVLKQNNDIELFGRTLVFLPIRHILCSVDFQYSGKYIIMYKSARRFYGQWLHFPPSAGARAELRGKGVWSREDADEMALFKDFLQNDVVPEVRSLENLDRYAENFGWVTVPEWAKNSEHRCFEMLPCAIARGAFDIARELAQIVEPYDDAYYQANVPGPVVDPTLFPPIRKLCQLLAVNDRKGMAEILHEMEEASITKSGLTHLWERTPFPIELMDA